MAFFPEARLAAQGAVPPGACLYALDSTASRAFQIAGAQSVYTACGVVSESSASDSFEMEGVETLYLENHAQVSVVGGAQLTGQTYLYDTIDGKNVQAVQTVNPGDPLASLAPPTSGNIVSSSPAYYDMNSKPVNNTLLPGVYCGGLTIGNTNGATLTFAPGVYIMAGGGLTLNSQAVVSGTGVTFYNTSSVGWGCSRSYNYTPITISGQVSVTLSAPARGAFDGVLFFGDRAGCATAGSCVDQINGGSTAILNGALYFASDKLEITGSNASGYTMLVADKIYINGNSNFGETGSPFDNITVNISPVATTLYAGQTQQFTVTVNNTGNTAVTWTISPADAGSIDSNGLYTAPASITAPQTVTVTAASQADSTKSAAATVTLMPPIAVTVSPLTAILYGGQTQQFTAAVANTNNTAVIWSISPAGAGSIDASGLYTAPAIIASQRAVSITATSAANPVAAASAIVTLMPPIVVSVMPPAAMLYAGQTQPFTATVANASNTAVTWSISPAGDGIIDNTGLYTAPASITTQQIVTITAASQENPSATTTATVTLMPPIAISISPTTATLYTNQTEQFTAAVANTTNTAVTWSISPADVGSISASGLYTAPAAITAQQTVTITATSQADSSVTATAAVTLALTQCNASGYNYARAITIDHTKVPNTDQANFPFLFNTTDPLLATTANGGHVANPSGYDIIFTSDPAGQNQLAYEMEEYNPATGKMVAWVRIPALSHTSDTVLYMFYGNPNVTASQQNPAQVWDSNYMGVWHLGDGSTLSLADSTSNANSATNNGAVEVTGPFAGGMQTNANAYATIGTPSSLANLAQGPATFSAWVNSAAGLGGILMGKDDNNSGRGWALSLNTNHDVDFVVVYSSSDFRLNSSGTTANNAWSYVVVTLNGHPTQSSSATIYINGSASGSGSGGSGTTNDDSAQVAYLANATYGDQVSAPFNGATAEFRISNTIRSADWIATEYANQSSSATFYSLSQENQTIAPSAVTLYGQQSQQFMVTALASCPAPVVWSMSPSGVGTLTQDGLYTAPTGIITQQTVTITATNTITNDMVSAVVTLMPPTVTPTLSLAAATPSPYVTGSAETFVATLKNQDGTALPGVTISFTVTGSNTGTGSSITGSTGQASFTYTGSNSGTDTIQATATVGSAQVTSGSVTAIWLVPSQPISTSTVYGAFFLTNNACAFDASAKTPVFTQTFPTINFNPPAGTVPGNTSNVNVNSRPFTDVTTDLNGNYTGTIIAEGNGYQAGVGSMNAFEAVFTGEFTVASAGNTVFNFYDDDGFIFGIGNGATRMSGASYNMPSTTIFENYPSMGADNGPQSPTGNQVVVNFPAAGKYPYEVDYTECDGGQLVLTMTQGATSPTGVAPTGSLTISPNSVNPLPWGGSQVFTVFAGDASGNPVPNVSVGLVVTGVDDLQLSSKTDSSGYATFVYKNVNSGTAYVQAVAFVSGMVTYSNMVTVPWTLPATTTSGTGGSGGLSISISAPDVIVLPKSLSLSGTVTDSSLPAGQTPSVNWSAVSGPGTVTFADPQKVATTASFSSAGTYVLQLSASDSVNSGSAQIQVMVEPEPSVAQGWIGSPANGAAVSGIVPIVLTAGETLQSGTLGYYPANNPNAVTILNANTTGSGQIGTLDTTALPNGSYWIILQATDTNGNTEYALALVTATGNYKPGRVTSTVRDLVVPATGLAINIQRSYDSLNAGTSSDFGYGWSLGYNVDLSIDPKGDVTFTLGGQRKTFYFAPQTAPCSPLIGCLFPWLIAPAFTPEPGLHGTLVGSSSGCPGGWDILLADGECQTGGSYTPPGYIYTDPNGTSYNISSTGGLQSITDRSGNGLTITPNGITSNTGLNVPFVRDNQGRITQITDPQGNIYLYGYNENGNLASVTYPNTSQPSTYTYDQNHYYLSGTDFRSNPLPSVDYYAQGDSDEEGNSLAGKMKSTTDALGETTTYAYDLSTNTTTVTYPPDASGNVGHATLVYDSLGDLLTSTDPLGNTTTDTYDANRNLLSATDPLGHTSSYTYDSNGNKTSQTYPSTSASTNTTSTTSYNQYSEPTSTTDELGNVRTFNYDANYNPAGVTDSLGTLMSTVFNTNGTLQSGAIGYDVTQNSSRASQFTYDANGDLTGKTDALGRTTSYTYNALGQKITMTEPVPSGSNAAAATTTYTYDPFGNLTQTSAPLGRVTSSTYDANGNRLTDADARGNTTQYQYDALNRLTLTTYPDGTTASKTYDFRGNVVRESDQGGHVTLHQYDLAGRQIAVTQAYGTSNATTTSYAYDNAGRMISQTDALGHTTDYAYDAAGNLLSVSGVKGNFTYAYDDARNRVSMADGNGHTTQYAYDARKRLTVTTYPDETTKTNAYDGAGNLISVTDQASNQVQYNYDAANQLVNVVQANSPNSGSNTTIYGYDANGNPIALEDANTHTTAQSFDLLSELTTKTLPDGTHTEARQYDNNGNLVSLTHFNGVTTTYAYDALNRLTSRSTPGETPVSFTYTPTGEYATSTDASGTTTYTYDNMDRLTAKATPEGTLNYTYDAAGHVESIASSHANGASMSYSYDSLDRLSTVVDNRLNGGTTAYAYDNTSNVATVTYPNGVQSTFAYDSLNRVTGLHSQPASYTYQRGPTGNLISAAESSGRTVSWSYDGIYRLTNETINLAPSKNNGTVSYGLDPVGNRLSESSSLPNISSGSWGYTPDDELSSEAYDANGNVTSTGGKTFSYDSENHLVSMNGNSVQVLYDAFGNRVAKSANGVVTRYLVEDDVNPTGLPQVMEELNSTGGVTRTYTYGLQRVSEDQIVDNAWTSSFYGYDGMGNVRQLTSSTGAVTDSYEYDAFGNSFTVSGTTPNNYLYRGEQYDPDLGLYYLRARYYNPTTGRFMSKDPLDGVRSIPVTLHKYLYAGGDPVNRIDPRGREDLVDYGIKLETTLKAPVVLNAIGCGVSIGSSLATGTLLEAFGDDPTGSAFTAFGCLTMTVSATGRVQVGLDAIALAGCGWGLYQAYQAENVYFEDLNEENYEKAEVDLQKVDAELFGSIGGCAITVGSLALE